MAQMKFNAGAKKAPAPTRPTTAAALTKSQAATANRYAAQADAYKNRAQTASAGRYQAAANAAKQAAYQKEPMNPAMKAAGQYVRNQERATPPAVGPYANSSNDPRNNPAYWRQNSTVAQRGQQFARNQSSDSNNQTRYGVDYGNNWQRSTYIPPADWRMGNMGQFAGMQMSYDEYVRRKQAREMAWDTNYQDWYRRGAEAANTMSQADFNAWKAANPRPVTAFDQLAQENILRQNAAPPGYQYVPYGPSYLPEAPLPDMAPPPADNGYYDPGYDGGDGGGYDYTPPKNVDEFWQNMVNWRIRTPQGG